MATISERLQYILQFDTRQAIQAVDQFGKKADQALDKDAKLDKLGSNMTKFGAAAVAAAGVAGVGLWSLAQGASDLNESINAVEVSYGDAGAAVTAMGEDAAEAFGLSRRQFNEMATMFGGFAQQLATGGKTSADVLQEMTGRAADFASVFNIDVAKAGALFQSGLAGETEALRRFGIDLSAASVEAYALENGISENVKQMTQAEKVTARYGLLLQSTEVYAGDFANTSDSLANQQKILAANMQNLKDGIGMGLLPMFNTLIGTLGKVTSAFAKLSPEAQSTIGTFAAVGTAGLGLAGVFLMAAGQVIKFRHAFRDADGNITKLGSAAKLATAGFAVLSVALIGFGLAANKASRDAQMITDNIKEMTRASDENLLAVFNQSLLDAVANGEGLNSTMEQLAETNLGTAQRIIQVAKAKGEETAFTIELEKAIQAEIEARQNQEKAAAAEADAVARAAGELDGQLNIMSDLEIASGRLRDTTVETTEEQAEAWQEWADEVSAAVDDATSEYEKMVDAAEQWGEDIHSQMRSGSESFYGFSADAETSADDMIAALQLENLAHAEWEQNLRTVFDNATGMTDDKKAEFIAYLGEMGLAGGPMVADLAANTDKIGPLYDEWVKMTEGTGDDMVAGLDVIAPGMEDKMITAKSRFNVQLLLIKSRAQIGGREIGGTLPDGIEEGMESGQSDLNAAGRAMMAELVSEIKAYNESESPSKLFKREVGVPIVEGIEEAIVEEGDKIGEALESAIKDAEKAAVDAAEELVDSARDALSGLWKDIGDERSEEDLRERVADATDDLADAEQGLTDATNEVADAEANLASVRDNGESTPEEIADAEERLARAREGVEKAAEKLTNAEERLEDAHYALARATEYMLGMDAAARASWIETATAAGLTKGQIDGLVSAYDSLTEAIRKSNEAKAEIGAEAKRATAIRNDFEYAVKHGWVDADFLKHLGSFSSDPGFQLDLMAGKLNDIQRYFGGPIKQYATGGIVPGIGAQLAVVHGGERITPADQVSQDANRPIVLVIEGTPFRAILADHESQQVAELMAGLR